MLALSCASWNYILLFKLTLLMVFCPELLRHFQTSVCLWEIEAILAPANEANRFFFYGTTRPRRVGWDFLGLPYIVRPEKAARRHLVYDKYRTSFNHLPWVVRQRSLANWPGYSRLCLFLVSVPLLCWRLCAVFYLFLFLVAIDAGGDAHTCSRRQYILP